jgi:hypothetical protein
VTRQPALRERFVECRGDEIDRQVTLAQFASKRTA